MSLQAIFLYLSHLLLMLLMCLGSAGATEPRTQDTWKIQLTVSGWGGHHIINSTSAGDYSFRRIRSGDLMEERCGTLSEAQREALQGQVRTLRALKDQIGRVWPRVGIDFSYAEVDVSWTGAGDVRLKLPILAPPMRSPDPPPDFLNELVVFLWSHRNSVYESCDPSVR